jgi:hypothetical protein
MIDENRKKRGRPPGGLNSIAANTEALAIAVFLIENDLADRGKRLPTRKKIIADVIANSINQYLKSDEPIFRKVRGKGSEPIRLKIHLAKGKTLVDAQWVIGNTPEGLPEGWFETTYTAVDRILPPRKK